MREGGVDKGRNDLYRVVVYLYKNKENRSLSGQKWGGG